MIFDVWHQWPPVKVVGVERNSQGEDSRIYEPAVKHRGQVEARSAAEAIEKAKKLRLSPWPMVRAQHG